MIIWCFSLVTSTSISWLTVQYAAEGFASISCDTDLLLCSHGWIMSTLLYVSSWAAVRKIPFAPTWVPWHTPVSPGSCCIWGSNFLMKTGGRWWASLKWAWLWVTRWWSKVKLFFCNVLFRNSVLRLKNAQAIQYKAQVLMPGFKDHDNVKHSAGENLEELAGMLSLEG